MKRVLPICWFLTAAATTISTTLAFSSSSWMLILHSSHPTRIHPRIATSSPTTTTTSTSLYLSTAPSLPTNPLSQSAAATGSRSAVDYLESGCTTCKTCGSIYHIDHKLFGTKRGLVIGCSVCNQKWLQFKDKLFTPYEVTQDLVPMTPEDVAQIQERLEERRRSMVATTTTTPTTTTTTMTTPTTQDPPASSKDTTHVQDEKEADQQNQQNQQEQQQQAAAANKSGGRSSGMLTTLSDIVCIHNLPKSLKKPDVTRLFAKAGKVVKVAFKMSYNQRNNNNSNQNPNNNNNNNNIKIGMAFVTMGSAEEAQRAIEMLDGKEVDGICLSMELSKVYRKEKKPPTTTTTQKS